MQVKSTHGPRKAGGIVADEPLWLRLLLIGAALTSLVGLILIPLVYVFVQAFQEGVSEFFSKLLDDPESLHAIWLTATIAPVAVILNTVFGFAAAWTITRFRFPGRTLLVTALDIPFAVSPVVAGLMFVLLFGMQGYFGPFIRDTFGLRILFAWPSLVLATTFVTLPFVARELIPLMDSLGSEEELAAITLGASPWQLFWKITLPNIKWGLVYGMIQCNARAIGEFGAVYVVSGRISGETITMPLRVDKLFQEYDNPGSYAMAAVLTLMAVVTLVGKIILEHYLAAQAAALAAEHNLEGETA